MFESVRVVAGKLAPVFLVGQFQGQKLDKQSLAHDAGGTLSAAAARPEATGELGRIVEAFPLGKSAPRRVLIVGLGEKDKFKLDQLRRAAAAVGRRIAQTKDTALTIDLSGPLAATRSDAAASGAAFGEGVGLLAWTCDVFRGKATKQQERTRLSLSSTDRDFAEGLSRGLALAESTNFARTLSQTPPNVATPYWMADQARRLASKVGLSFRIFKGPDLEREKFQGLINVGKASENKPCMIRLAYSPRGKKIARPIVLIGKTVCYDTGGLSLKINNGMVGMKRDKDGGCAVLGAMHAIATVIKPRVPVVALLAAAENSISDEAYRPDDIIRYRNNVTVEVTNTDAEGRLVLADALTWACDQEKPAAIIDLATLTGGVVTALGSTFAGMFCDNDKLRAKVEEAAEAAGERVWRLPFHQEYRDMMKSPVADIVNSNPNRKAHAGEAPAFLSYFVEESVPWCHLDIAGVHAVESDNGPFIQGPTGWGVRLLANLLEAE